MSTAAQTSAQPAKPASKAFNWIEWLAIPLTRSIMSAQPIALAQLILLVVFADSTSSVLLDSLALTLIFLGLQWSARSIQSFTKRRPGSSTGGFLHVVSLLVTCGLVVWTHLALTANFFGLIIALGIIIWAWRTGMQAASQGPTEEYLLAEFRYGFIALLGMIIMSVVLLSASYSYDSGNVDMQQIHANIFTALTQGLILYFVSGTICLSFMRVAIIRH